MTVPPRSLCIVPRTCAAPRSSTSSCAASCPCGARPPRADVLVVDDGSPAARARRAARAPPHELGFELIAKDANEGFARTVNVGLRRALEHGPRRRARQRRHRVHRGRLARARCRAAPTPRAARRPSSARACCTPTAASSTPASSSRSLDREWWHRCRVRARRPAGGARARRCPVTGALQLIRHETLEQIGLYDEAFRMGYEDVDYCLRVFDAGLECIYEPPPSRVHHESVFRGASDAKIERWTASPPRGCAIKWRHDRPVPLRPGGRLMTACPRTLFVGRGNGAVGVVPLRAARHRARRRLGRRRRRAGAAAPPHRAACRATLHRARHRRLRRRRRSSSSRGRAWLQRDPRAGRTRASPSSTRSTTSCTACARSPTTTHADHSTARRRGARAVHARRRRRHLLDATGSPRRYRSRQPAHVVCRNGIDLARYALHAPAARRTSAIGWAGGTGHSAAVGRGSRCVGRGHARASRRALHLRRPAVRGLARATSSGRARLRVPFTALEVYPAAMTHFDIALAPAGTSNFFRGKSDLRWLEAAALACPASPTRTSTPRSSTASPASTRRTPGRDGARSSPSSSPTASCASASAPPAHAYVRRAPRGPGRPPRAGPPCSAVRRERTPRRRMSIEATLQRIAQLQLDARDLQAAPARPRRDPAVSRARGAGATDTASSQRSFAPPCRPLASTMPARPRPAGPPRPPAGGTDAGQARSASPSTRSARPSSRPAPTTPRASPSTARPPPAPASARGARTSCRGPRARPGAPLGDQGQGFGRVDDVCGLGPAHRQGDPGRRRASPSRAT